MVTQYSRAENARGQEVAAQTGVAAEKAGDGLVAKFFVHESVVGRGESWVVVPLAYRSGQRSSMRSD